MGLSFLTYTARGRGPYPIHGLDYLSTAHLAVKVNGTPVSATVDDIAKTVLLAAEPAAGATVRIERTTPRRQEQRLTQFRSLLTGSAGLTAALVDQDARQNMLVMGEGRDLADALPLTGGMMLGAGAQWDGEAKRVENLLVGSSPGDAVAKSQLDAVVAAARPLPTVSGADDDDGLFVTAGEFDDRTPAECRTHLALGTVALLAAGTGANQVPQFSSDAPPRYPTVDGRNIDLTNHAIQTDISKRALATVVRWASINVNSPGQDPAVATWSQNSASRFPHSTGWASRVELNNSSDVDGSSLSPRRISLSAGTWRIRWLFVPRFPLVGSANNYTSLRITNDDDTSAQVIYYDLGLHRPSVDFGGNDASMLPDSVLLSFASPAAIVFRYSNRLSAAGNDCDLIILCHKISTAT